jgi:hypothetical protein
MRYAIFSENRHQADKLVGWLGTRPTNLSAILTKILTKELGFCGIQSIKSNGYTISKVP